MFNYIGKINLYFLHDQFIYTYLIHVNDIGH